MKEIMLPYAFIMWILVKAGVIKWNLRNATLIVSFGAFLATSLFTVSRFWAPVDLTDSSTIKAPHAVLSPLVGQKVKGVYVTHNQIVKKGELLYTLESTDSVEQIKGLHAQIEAIEHQISSTETQVMTDKKNLERLVKLDEYSSQIERDDLNNQIQKSYSELSELRAQITNVRAQISESEYLNNLNKIVAPFDGQMGVINISQGTRTGNMHIYDTSKKFLEMRVSDQTYRYIKVGQFAEFYVNSHPGEVFRGKVHSITSGTGEAKVSVVNGSQSVSQHVGKNTGTHGRTVIIEFEEPKGYLIPIGATGSAWISATKPHPLLGFMDIIGGATVRLKALKSYLNAL
ncbi:HlyD family secretion protein [Vibrio crassostreae]|uniref:HlyD family secretion protein n=1 Tax=Vibrio crassostreae TaxID=246167 RepID=UPI0010444AB1|nr:efflux RND transporter periplasmic adaptor subunit [Vibrio crassostreae]TCN91226.1 multidrug resistance efflux pump [Vibrio crassostreae]CAK2059564.1 Multidrug resistance efflux pump [Vibrio crassostreae]CAK2845342.1 Multidrug resistance efflux pump [Vibrio crassostreae]CAK2884300.1 Multidrug resistance efflux pump [Vibrio crassostreae]CAK2930886.1 Multidrug resistance efflux pump [Vibrio crassostreae]